MWALRRWEKLRGWCVGGKKNCVGGVWVETGSDVIDRKWKPEVETGSDVIDRKWKPEVTS